jgi:predicted nucleotidyltransferase
MPIPPFTVTGDLPPGVHRATLAETVERFGRGSFQRQVLAQRLERIHQLAHEAGHVRRFVVFGSFVTNKQDPNDVDIFMIVEDAFEPPVLGEARFVFEHTAAQDRLGASIFWMRQRATFGREQAFMEEWQATREEGQRGIVEIVRE